MKRTDKKTESRLIVPVGHEKKSEETINDIRQERLDQLMKSFEDGFPGFYQALETLKRENRSQSPK